MNRTKGDAGSPIEWAAAGLSLAGEPVSGDCYVVKTLPEGVLTAVIDGLGHGREAAAAAQIAAAIINDNADEALVRLVQRCHKRLLGTRGVVLSMASINARNGTMTWLGVGNIEGVLLRNKRSGSEAAADASPSGEHLLLRGGILGYQLPSLIAATIPIRHGDILIFVTDGIASNFSEGLDLDWSVRHMADRILARHGKKTDDALVLVVCYLGKNNV